MKKLLLLLALTGFFAACEMQEDLDEIDVEQPTTTDEDDEADTGDLGIVVQVSVEING